MSTSRTQAGPQSNWLDPVELADSEGFRAHELNRVREMVIEHRDAFRRTWDEYHRS